MILQHRSQLILCHWHQYKQKQALICVTHVLIREELFQPLKKMEFRGHLEYNAMEKEVPRLYTLTVNEK